MFGISQNSTISHWASHLASYNPSLNVDLLFGAVNFLGAEHAIGGVLSNVLAGRNNGVGAYASPGMFFAAKQLGRTLPNGYWKSLYPGDTVSLGSALKLDSPSKYNYYGLLSGTEIAPFSNIPDCLERNGGKIITVDSQRGSRLCTIHVYRADGGWSHLENIQPAVKNNRSGISISASILTISIAGVLALMGDWYAFSMLSLTTACNHALARIISSDSISVIKHTASGVPLPPGHGILSDGSNELLAVFGDENAVNSIVKAKLHVKPSSQTKLGVTCVAIQALAIAQLGVLPQATFSGQVLVLASFVIGYFANVLHFPSDFSGRFSKLVTKGSGAKHVATIKANNRGSAFAALSILTGTVNAHVYQKLLANDLEWRRWIAQLEQVASKDSSQWQSELLATESNKYTDDIKAAIEAVSAALKNDQQLESFQKFAQSSSKS